MLSIAESTEYQRSEMNKKKRCHLRDNSFAIFCEPEGL